MPENEKLIHRRAIFLRVYELEGFCHGLSQALAVGQSPGPMTQQYFRTLVKGASDVLVGPGKDEIPDIEPNPSPTDMLVVASILRSLLTAFLTPDEREEQQSAQPFGFAAGTRASKDR
jgi:hypothetical protein